MYQITKHITVINLLTAKSTPIVRVYFKDFEK